MRCREDLLDAIEYKKRATLQEERMTKVLERIRNSQESIILFGSNDYHDYFITYRAEHSYKGVLTDMFFVVRIFKKYSSFIEHGGDLWAEPVYNTEHNYLEDIILTDILIKTWCEDMGYGSILMEQLIKYSKQLGANSVIGKFSRVDDTESNRERRYHFYKKFGFEIDGDLVSLNLRK